MRETPFLKYLRLAFGARPDVRLFRNTVGMGWHGEEHPLANGDLLLKNPRRVTFGLGNDTPDLVGFITVTVTPEMVGQKVAVFTGVEVKGRMTRTTDGQIRFLKFLRSMGGIAMLLREGKQPDTIDETIY